MRHSNEELYNLDSGILVNLLTDLSIMTQLAYFRFSHAV